MTIRKAQRFEMHLGLRDTLGDVVAHSLMEYLPPGGWSNVARTGDIDRVDARIDRLEAEMRGFKSVRTSMRFIIGSILTVAAGIVALLIQINESISGL